MEDKIVDHSKQVKLYSVALVLSESNEEILLGYKKTGFGIGKWNGFGGKIKQDETIEECCKRELFEECSLLAEDLEKVGIIVYEFINQSYLMEIHFFKIKNYSGVVQESNEMLPKWFDIKNVPMNEMWVDCNYWYPLFLDNQRFNGYFLYEDNENILYKRLNILKPNEKIKAIYKP